MKRRRKKKTSHAQACLVPFSSVSPYQHFGCKFSCVCVCVCVCFVFFFLFTNYSSMQKGAKTGRSGIHLHSYWFVLLLLCFFSENREQDGISRGQKETERESFKQQNPWVSVPQGSVWLPCGCNVFVRPSPLITIMSLERSMRARFLCLCVLSASVFVNVQEIIPLQL